MTDLTRRNFVKIISAGGLWALLGFPLSCSQHSQTSSTVNEKCQFCGGCVVVCPKQALELIDLRHLQVDQAKCISCGNCVTICPVKGIDIK